MKVIDIAFRFSEHVVNITDVEKAPGFSQRYQASIKEIFPTPALTIVCSGDSIKEALTGLMKNIVRSDFRDKITLSDAVNTVLGYLVKEDEQHGT